MNKLKLSQKGRGMRIVRGVFAFLGCYLLLMAVILLMVIINDVKGWTSFLVNNLSSVVSLLVFVFLLCGIVYYYYYFEDKEFLERPKNVFLIFSVIILALALSYVFGKFVDIYARPYALLALLFLFLFGRRQAIMLNFVNSLLVFFVDIYTNSFILTSSAFTYHSLMLGFVCGTVAVFTAGGVKTRGGLLAVSIVLSIPTVLMVTLLELPAFKALGWTGFLTKAGWGALGCVLSSVLALALMPVYELIFNRLTVFRLREMTSPDAPLLKRLKKEAPGTFNHSLIVAQLAESCAIALGEDAELARAAAYYHDVGKLKQPDCFTENQTDYNIHDELTPELSADIIRTHASDGYELLVSSRLPHIFADVAREHHGSMPIKYFYAKAVRISGDDVNVKDYSYFGPTPSTTIAAIIMICDASEAAVRALKEHSPQSVERVVRSIIEERMDMDQFVNCDITMRDLTTIKQTIVAALSGVHHHRVEYPAIRFNRGGGTQTSE